MSEPSGNPGELTGAALAAAVAEKVMGWTCRHDGMADKWFKPDGKWEYVVKHYHPDLNIAQAIEVVQRMIELNWNFSLEWEPTHGERPIAGFCRHAARDADDAVFVAGDTIPEAICKAALKAVNTP